MRRITRNFLAIGDEKRIARVAYPVLEKFLEEKGYQLCPESAQFQLCHKRVIHPYNPYYPGAVVEFTKSEVEQPETQNKLREELTQSRTEFIADLHALREVPSVELASVQRYYPLDVQNEHVHEQVVSSATIPYQRDNESLAIKVFPLFLHPRFLRWNWFFFGGDKNSRRMNYFVANSQTSNSRDPMKHVVIEVSGNSKKTEKAIEHLYRSISKCTRRL